MMEIKETKNKVKIIIEYLKKTINFAQIVKEDLAKINIKIFLKDGRPIFTEDIQSISINKQDFVK